MSGARELFDRALATRHQPEERERLLNEAAAVAEGDLLGEILLALGNHGMTMGSWARARDPLERAIPLLQSKPGRLGECLWLLWIVKDTREEGDLPRALELLEQSAEHLLAGSCCIDLAFVRGEDLLFVRSIASYRKVDSGYAIPVAWHKRAKLALKQGREEHGIWCCEEARKLLDDLGPGRLCTRIKGEVAETAGDISAAMSRAGIAAFCYREAQTFFENVEVGTQRVAEKLRQLRT